MLGAKKKLLAEQAELKALESGPDAKAPKRVKASSTAQPQKAARRVSAAAVAETPAVSSKRASRKKPSSDMSNTTAHNTEGPVRKTGKRAKR